MSGHRSFGTLRAKMSPERQARNAKTTAHLLQEMSLQELRQARAQSQQDLAREMKIGQPAVAKLERRADMYVSNLRRYVEALGGTLEITAKFPDSGSVNIKKFGEIAGTIQE